MCIKNLNNIPTLPPTDPETLAGVHMKVSKVCESFDESFVNQPYGIVRDRFVSDSPFDNYKSDICQHYTEYAKSLSHISDNMPKISSFLQELGIIIRENQVDVLERCKSIDSSIVDTNDFTTFLDIMSEIKKPFCVSDILNEIDYNPEALTIWNDFSGVNEKMGQIFIADLETTLAKSLSSLSMEKLHILNNFVWNHPEISAIVMKSHLLGLVGIVAYVHLNNALADSRVLPEIINRITLLRSSVKNGIANFFGLYNTTLLSSINNLTKKVYSSMQLNVNSVLSTKLGKKLFGMSNKIIFDISNGIKRSIPVSIKVMLQNSNILSPEMEQVRNKTYLLEDASRSPRYIRFKVNFAEDLTTKVRTISKIGLNIYSNKDYNLRNRWDCSAFRMVKAIELIKQSSSLHYMDFVSFCELIEREPTTIWDIFDQKLDEPVCLYSDEISIKDPNFNKTLSSLVIKKSKHWSKGYRIINDMVRRDPNISVSYFQKSSDADIYFFIRCNIVDSLNAIDIAQILVKVGQSEKLADAYLLTSVICKFQAYSRPPKKTLDKFCIDICRYPKAIDTLFIPRTLPYFHQEIRQYGHVDNQNR